MRNEMAVSQMTCTPQLDCIGVRIAWPLWAVRAHNTLAQLDMLIRGPSSREMFDLCLLPDDWDSWDLYFLSYDAGADSAVNFHRCRESGAGSSDDDTTPCVPSNWPIHASCDASEAD